MTRHSPAVLLGGDSTVASCPAGETPMSGWGAHLAGPLNARVNHARGAAGLPPATVGVLNAAKGGATTASYREEGLWDALLQASRPGDTVVLQFGHNDQKQPDVLAARGGFSNRLRAFVAEARAHGLTPMLATSVERRHFDGDAVKATHGDYPQATRDVAADLGVACIDLTPLTAARYAELGPEASRALFTHFPAGAHPLYPDGIADDTHFSFPGALEVAEMVAAALAPLLTDPAEEAPPA